MIKKTLGGDRLGSGNKMQVELHAYERSTHDLSYIWRSTMSAGTLVPFMNELTLPGDTFDITLDCDVKTHPTIGPLFGSYKVQLDVFHCPIRLYQGQLHNNKLGIGRDMSQVKLPVMEFNCPPSFGLPITDIDNAQVNPSCIMAYLGIRGMAYNGTSANVKRLFNAVPYLAYWDIYKNYYANKQEEIGAVIHTPRTQLVNTVTNVYMGTTLLPQQPSTTLIPLKINSDFGINFSGAEPKPSQILVEMVGKGWISMEDLVTEWLLVSGGAALAGNYNFTKWGNQIITSWRYQDPWDLGSDPPSVRTFPLENLDTARENIMTQLGPNAVKVNDWTGLEPYSLLLRQNFVSYDIPTLQNQEGLALKTYQSDLFNNWLSSEWISGINGINEITAISTTGGSFNLDTLYLSNKIYNMLNRIAVSGGTYEDWIDAVYTHERYTRSETPTYHGGLSKELVFQEVVSNTTSTSEAGGQPLGTLAGKGILSKKHKGGNVRIKVDEPGYILANISITPRIDYSQGNKWHMYSVMTMNDLHKPALDQIGFQDSACEQMAWWSTIWDGTNFITPSYGKQTGWIHYQTNVNKVYGNFAIPNNEMFMTLNRRYEFDMSNLQIKDLTTYIDPSKFNNIFAQTSLDAQNFWVQIAVNITARRKMSAKVMPNL